MDVDYNNCEGYSCDCEIYSCDSCDAAYYLHCFWDCKCGEIYCDDCVKDIEKKYGIDEENDWLNKCNKCDEEILPSTKKRKMISK